MVQCTLYQYTKHNFVPKSSKQQFAMDSTVNDMTQNCSKIIASTTTTKIHSSNVLSNQNICNQISNKRFALKRTTAAAAAIFLYISYCSIIHLLWTNVVMYTESAQNAQHSNHSNFMDSLWQIKSNSNSDNYRNHNSKLNSNSNESLSNRQIPKFSELFDANVSKERNIQIDFDAQFTAYFNSKNGTFNSSVPMKFRRTSDSILLPLSLEWPSFHLNKSDGNDFIGKSGNMTAESATSVSSASTPSSSRLNKRKKFRSNQQNKQQPIYNRYKRTMGQSLSIKVLHKIGPNVPFVASLIHEQNEFRDLRRYKRDENEFTKYHNNENVIKSAENHAIKMKVNNFTPKILETNTNSNRIAIDRIRYLPNMSQIEMENQSVSMQNDVITTDSSSSSLVAIAMALSFDHKNDNRTETTFESEELIGNMASDTLTQLNLGNGPVNDDSKLNISNKTVINRMENERNYSYNRMTTTTTNDFNEPLDTITKIPTTIVGLTETSISSGSMLERFRVNDVFEIERKQKYFSNKKSMASLNGPVNGNNNSHEDNQIASNANDSNGTKIISLLGLFELSTRNKLRPEGQTELAAAKMAVDHINKRGLLPGYTLQLITNDTKCDPGIGVDRFFHALYTQYRTRILMLLGSACSEVTESLAKVVPYWNILQVSFGSTSPALSDRSEFPLFYRTVAPDSSHNPARIAFIRRFGWDTVTTFSQNEEIHSLAVNDLVTELENANISCAATITFAETDFKNQLKMLRDLDTRIIIGSFSHELAPKVFCEAYKLGMYGADYVWILHEIVGIPWWHRNLNDSECNRNQLQEVAENLLMVSSYNSILSNEISHSGLTYSMFIDELNSMVALPQTLSRYAAQTYDAVWAIALVLKNADIKWKNDSTSQLRLDHFDYTRYDMAMDFLHHFSRLNFSGVSGPVSFSGADRVGISVFNQVQNGHLKSVALFHPSRLHLDFDCPKCVPIKWKSGQVPIAKRVFKLRVATIAPVAFFVVSTLALIGIILSIAFLAFNLHFRNLKAIKLSSPKLSNITAFGCILVYAAVILLGLDYSTLPANEKAFPIVCTARVYLLSSGFSLAFGSMFAKTYRVHRIFTRSGSSVCKDKMLQDTQLISLVCALLLLDGLVVTLWVLADPMERHLNNLTLEISSTDRSVVYQPQIEVCRSQHTQTWLGALYIYKGLLLVVGVYMAWETRHVKIPALNDSQYIGVSVYSVVITSAIVVVLANLIAERVTLAFITITALILTSTTATLCLLFLPKMHDIWGKGVVNDPVIHCMGLKMECNTRRFMIDDKRELQYRVEVQNRVYKKELAALDIEIGKLERMLESPSTTSSSDLSIPRLIKHELAVVNEEYEKSSKQRTPSIGDGLPLLLLSVLPPVIPRASWPLADASKNTMHKSVTFSSQPQLEDESSVARLPAIDLFRLRLTHQEATEPRGFIDRIIGFFGNSKPPSRKASTSSIAGGSSGLAAAFKAHMGLFSNFVPTASSCNAIDTAGIEPLRRMSIARSGNAIDQRSSSLSSGILLRDRSRHFPLLPPFIIGNENESINNKSHAPRKNLYVDIDHEPKVNFQLPLGRRPSIFQQQTLRERVKGSPRFPHRIAPYNSLNALVENAEASGDDNKSKWKSMEDTKIFYSTEPSTFDANNG